MMLSGMKKVLEVEAAAGVDVSLQYFYFLISELLFPENHRFRNTPPPQLLILSEFFQAQHSHYISPVYFLFCLFNIFLFSLSRNPNVSFFCSQFVHFPSLRRLQSLFHSTYFAFIFSCFLYFFLSHVVYNEFCPHPTPPHLSLYHSKVFSLNSFFFSSQAFLLASIYHLETPSHYL